MDAATITIESLIRLGSCVLLTDEANKVLWASERLRCLIGSDCAGKNLEDLVVPVDRPLISLSLRSGENAVLPLRGDWLPLDGGRLRVFVGSPAPETTEEMTRLGITLNDYLENDSWLNYLVKSDEAISTQRDAVERIAQFKQERARLTEARDQMVDARRAGLNMMLDLEQARIAAEGATQSKSEFLANMSHEIRTPMTAILGFAENLLDPDLSESDRLNAVHTVRRNGGYLLSIINDILDLSKVEAGKMIVEHIPCGLSKIVAEVGSLVKVKADEKGLSFNIEYIGAVPKTIQTDPTRLRQILINLIGNAIKFTEIGGVRLVIRFVDDGDKPLMQFDVVDNGVGMTEEQAAGLFQPFTQADTSTTRKFGGTGLGLTISKRFAEMLGGGISVVDSQEGVGTRFRVGVATGPLDGVKMLDDPVSTTVVTSDATKATVTADQQDLEGCCILLAEDGLDNQRLIVHVLKKAGADVTVVENGKFAADAALAARDGGKPFDVILMDMQMPVMDGYEATGLLRQRGYTGPIIALTAHAMAGDRDKCIDAGCDDYAAKPIDRKRLIKTIHAYLQPAAASGPT